MEVNYFKILYWFCHTSTWIHHRYTRVPHPEPLLPPPTPYHPSGSSQCTSPKHQNFIYLFILIYLNLNSLYFFLEHVFCGSPFWVLGGLSVYQKHSKREKRKGNLRSWPWGFRQQDKSSFPAPTKRGKQKCWECPDFSSTEAFESFGCKRWILLKKF